MNYQNILTILLNIIGRSILIVHEILLILKVLSISDQSSPFSANESIYLVLVFSIFLVYDLLKSVFFIPRLESKWYSRSILFFILTELPLMWMLQIEKSRLVQMQKLSNQTEIINNSTISKTHEKSEALLIESIELWSQSFYMVIVISRILIPKRHCSLEQMSNLGLLLLGTASDLQEFQAQMDEIFEINKSKINIIFIVVLVTWTWSILLLVINLDRSEPKANSRFVDGLIQSFYWKVTINLFLNDIPYLLVRLLILFKSEQKYEAEENPMHESFFFMVKNVIGIAVGVSRFWIPLTNKID